MHADEGAHAAVAALHLLHDEAVLDVVHSGAAIAIDSGAEEAHFSHGLDQFAREAAFAVAPLDDGNKIVFNELARGVAYHEFFFGKQRIEFDEIETLKFDCHSSSGQALSGPTVMRMGRGPAEAVLGIINLSTNCRESEAGSG